MSLGGESLYERLPAYLRNRDWYEGEPLRALLALLGVQHDRLRRDVDGLYEDWFIETCQERIVPLLADLLGVRGLDDPRAWVAGQRTRVANSLRYRQAKGTAATLARVARDVTGWPAATRVGLRTALFAQSLRHLRLERGRVVDLRDGLDGGGVDGPFGELDRTVRLSRCSDTETAGGCRPGLGVGEVGFDLWRLKAYPVRGWTARSVGAGFTFHPLGFDMPLFTRPRSAVGLDRPIEPANVPMPLSRARLAEALAAWQPESPYTSGLLAPNPPFEIADPVTGAPVPWEEIRVADLSEWSASESPEAADAAAKVVVDPELGRFAYVGRSPLDAVRVSCVYGLADDLGGGAYERPSVVEGVPWVRSAAIGGGSREPGVPHFATVLDAVDSRPRGSETQVLQITDSATYGGVAGLPLIVEVRSGSWLAVEAAPGQFPCYLGDLVFVAEDESPATRVTLSGLMIGGTLRLHGSLDLELRHCTVLTPPELDVVGPSVVVEGAPRRGSSVRIEHSIVGPLRLPNGLAGLEVVDSVVDGRGGYAIAAADDGAPGPLTGLVRSTVLGPVSVADVRAATDTLFAGDLRVHKASCGLLAHCYALPGPGPMRERCVPDEALAAAAGAGAREEIRARLRPVFTARSYGQPGYAQLSRRTPAEIRTGAESGAEIGVFERLRNPQREHNLSEILDEYMPWGARSRVVFRT